MDILEFKIPNDPIVRVAMARYLVKGVSAQDMAEGLGIPVEEVKKGRQPEPPKPEDFHGNDASDVTPVVVPSPPTPPTPQPEVEQAPTRS